MLSKLLYRRVVFGAIFIAALFITSLFIIYCSDSHISTPGPSTESPRLSNIIDISFEDSVEVYNIAADSENAIVTFSITVYHQQSVSGYKAELKTLEPSYEDTGYIALLYNSSQTDTLWQYVFKWDLDNPTWVGTWEIADDDEFYFEFLESGENYIETFIQNNDSLIVTYDASLFDGMRGDTSGYSQQDKNIVDSLYQQFEEFYDTTLAINYNYNGELFTHLLYTDDFWDLINEKIFDGNPPKDEEYRINVKEIVCGIAAALSLKCRIFPNVACYGLGPAKIVCAILGLAGSFHIF